MDKEIRDKLEIRARHIGLRFAKYFETSSNSWRDYQGTPLTQDMPDDKTMIFRLSDRAFIVFIAPTPKDITKEILHKPLLLDKKINDVSAIEVVNASDNMLVERAYDLTTTETKTFNEHVGVSVETTLTQKIGYSSPGGTVSGETSISLAVGTSYDKEWGGSNTVSRSSTTSVEVPPMTKATLTVMNSKSNFEQRTEYWCDLDHKIEIHYKKGGVARYDSMGKMKAVMEGKGSNNDAFGAQHRAKPRPVWDVNHIVEPVDVYADTTIYFSNAVAGDVKVTKRALQMKWISKATVRRALYRLNAYKGNSAFKGNKAFKGNSAYQFRSHDAMGRSNKALEDAKRGAQGQTKSSEFRKLKRYLRNKWEARQKRYELEKEYDRDDDILDAIDEARDDRKEDREQQEQEDNERQEKETL